MPTRVLRVAAWAVAAAAGVMLVAAVFVMAGSGRLTLIGDPGVLTLLSPLISALVGAVVIDRRGNHLVGWLFCLSGLGWAIYQLGMAVGLVGWYDDARIWQLAAWATSWSSFVAFGLTPVLVLYVFPTGRLTGPRWRMPFALAVGGAVIGGLGFAFAPGPLEDLPHIENIFGASGSFGTLAEVFRELAWPAYIAAIAAGVGSLRQRHRHAATEERQQIKWLLLAGAALFAFIIFWGVTESLGRPDIASTVAGLFVPLVPLALGVAILRHRLYDIDVLINRTLVYASLSAVLAVVYFGAVLVLGRILTPGAADSNIAVAVSTLAVAALFRPLRTQIQRFIDRRFYRQKYNAAAAVSRFSVRLREQVELETLGQELLGAVGETLSPSSATIWLKTKELP